MLDFLNRRRSSTHEGELGLQVRTEDVLKPEMRLYTEDTMSIVHLVSPVVRIVADASILLASPSAPTSSIAITNRKLGQK